MVRASCVLNVLFGSVTVQGTIVPAGKSAVIKITNRAPFVEILPEYTSGGTSYTNELGNEISAKIRAEQCFEPPLELHDLEADFGKKTCPSTIHFGPEILDKTLLLSKALNLVLPPLKIVTILGETKVGKTTLVNYLGNYFFSGGANVYMLDLDLGQPCAFMPGFISLRKLSSIRIANDVSWKGDEPTCGTDEIICAKFVGDFSTEILCELFEKRLAEVATEIKRLQLSGIMLVNTSGFVKGVGLFSTAAIVDTLTPHVIIQFCKARSEYITKTLPNPRRFNFIESRGDFIREKITVLSIAPLSPQDGSKPGPTTRESRQAAIWSYFEKSCIEFTIPVKRVLVNLVRQSNSRQLPQDTPAEVVALSLVGAVCGVVINSSVEVPILFTDCDITKQLLYVRVEAKYRYALAENLVRVYRSEYSQLEIDSGPSLGEPTSKEGPEHHQTEVNEGKTSENDYLSAYRHRVFWSGPMIGVGGKAVRRKSSKRKG